MSSAKTREEILQLLAEKMIRLGWATKTIILRDGMHIEFTPEGLDKLRAVHLVLGELDPISYPELDMLRALARLHAESDNR